jgi:putative transposase
MEHGHHVHSDGVRVRVPGGGHGLVQPVRAEMEVPFCIEALEKAFRWGRPEIFNSDQGSQFTSEKFTGVLKERDIAVSMDGRGRCLDNIFIERLWRSLKYEEVYLRDYRLVSEARAGISRYFQFYNYERPHQSLEYRTPADLYRGRCVRP